MGELIQEWALPALFIVSMLSPILISLFSYFFAPFTEETYYVDDTPYFRLNEIKDNKLLEKIREAVKKGPFVRGKDDYLVEATITHKGKSAAQLKFFPEAFSIMSPVEFIAKVAEVKPQDVRVMNADGKLVLSAGKYALVFPEGQNIEVARQEGYSSGYWDGFDDGFMAGSRL